MRTRALIITSLVAALSAVTVGCGAEEESATDGLGGVGEEAVEGEPLHLGDLIYNVAITRFLNPNIVEDSEYLDGLPEEPTGQSYLGVFIRIENDNDEYEIPSAQNYAVTDASHRVWEPVEQESLQALDIGAVIPPEGEIPAPDTTAANSATQGAILLFLVPDDVSEERPLELEIDSTLGDGTIALDI